MRRPLDVAFLLTCVIFTLIVLIPEIWGQGKSKDYPLWYWAGQQVLHRAPLYGKTNGSLDFIYPPTGAILLALPAYLGKIPLYFLLALLNSIAWWMSGQLSQALATPEKITNQWLEALPALLTITFVFDMYDLGQPNLFLLMLMLFGFWWMQQRRPWAAGSMFALATAIKVFPVTVFPYLIFRRHWKTAASMAVFLVLLLVVLPAPIRGYARNLSELQTWFHDMIGSASESGFGQRNEQNWSWVNQSIIAEVHRFVRPVDYTQAPPLQPHAYINVIDVSYQTANWLVLIVFTLIGLGFVAMVPRQSQMTQRSTADEIGILFCLMTVASPLARQYYFIWLFFPLTVLLHRIAFDPRPRVRAWTWGVIALASCLATLSFPFFKDLSHLFQALGNNLAATAVIIAGLAWHMRHPPAEASRIAITLSDTI